MKFFSTNGFHKGAAVFDCDGFSISWSTLCQPQEIVIFQNEQSTTPLAAFPGTLDGLEDARTWCHQHREKKSDQMRNEKLLEAAFWTQ